MRFYLVELWKRAVTFMIIVMVVMVGWTMVVGHKEKGRRGGGQGRREKSKGEDMIILQFYNLNTQGFFNN